MRQGKAFLGNFEDVTVLDPGLETETRHIVTQGLSFAGTPGFDDFPCGIETRIVIKQADPERRQSRQPPPGHAVGAPHFEVALKPYLGKNRRQVIGPVRQRRALAWKCGAFSVKEVAER